MPRRKSDQSAGVDLREVEPATLGLLRGTLLEMFASRDYGDVSIRDVCSRANVSPQTVYKYFGNKEQMLFSCIRDDLDRLNERVIRKTKDQPDVTSRIRAFIETWCNFYARNLPVARIVFLRIPQAYWVADSQFLQANIRDAGVAVLKHGQATGELWDGLSADLLMDMMAGAAHRIMIRWLTVEPSKTRALRDALVDTLLRMVLAR